MEELFYVKQVTLQQYYHIHLITLGHDNRNYLVLYLYVLLSLLMYLIYLKYKVYIIFMNIFKYDKYDKNSSEANFLF